MFVITGRRQGKTHKVVKWWLEDPEHRVVVTAARGHVNHFIREVEKELIRSNMPAEFIRRYMELARHQIVYFTSPDQFRGMPYEFAVEDMDHLLARIFGRSPSLVTMTATDLRDSNARG
jgi:hypothetical protein